jgi:hypothetical protein
MFISKPHFVRFTATNDRHKKRAITNTMALLSEIITMTYKLFLPNRAWKSLTKYTVLCALFFFFPYCTVASLFWFYKRSLVTNNIECDVRAGKSFYGSSLQLLWSRTAVICPSNGAPPLLKFTYSFVKITDIIPTLPEIIQDLSSLFKILPFFKTKNKIEFVCHPVCLYVFLS